MGSRRLCLFLVFRIGESKEHIRKVCGDAVFERTGHIWGLDPEGELNGVWRDLGVKGLWSMVGKLSLFSFSALVKFAGGDFMSCRFYSKHVALRTWFSLSAPRLSFERFSRICTEIKAMEEGLFERRYSLAKS